MDLLEHLRRQFAYDAWANREVLATLSASAHPGRQVAAATPGAHSFRRRALARTHPEAAANLARMARFFSRPMRRADRRPRSTLAGLFRQACSRRPFDEPHLQKHQGRALDQHCARHFDPCAAALGVSSRTDCQRNARWWRAARLHGLHPRGAPGFGLSSS